MRREDLSDLIRRQLAMRCPCRKVDRSGKGRSGPLRFCHAATLLLSAEDGTGGGRRKEDVKTEPCRCGMPPSAARNVTTHHPFQVPERAHHRWRQVHDAPRRPASVRTHTFLTSRSSRRLLKADYGRMWVFLKSPCRKDRNRLQGGRVAAAGTRRRAIGRRPKARLRHARRSAQRAR